MAYESWHIETIDLGWHDGKKRYARWWFGLEEEFYDNYSISEFVYASALRTTIYENRMGREEREQELRENGIISPVDIYVTIPSPEKITGVIYEDKRPDDFRMFLRYGAVDETHENVIVPYLESVSSERIREYLMENDNAQVIYDESGELDDVAKFPTTLFEDRTYHLRNGHELTVKSYVGDLGYFFQKNNQAGKDALTQAAMQVQEYAYTCVANELAMFYNIQKAKHAKFSDAEARGSLTITPEAIKYLTFDGVEIPDFLFWYGKYKVITINYNYEYKHKREERYAEVEAKLAESLVFPEYAHIGETLIEGVEFANKLERVFDAWRFVVDAILDCNHELGFLRPDQPRRRALEENSVMRELFNEEVKAHVYMIARMTDLRQLVTTVNAGVPLEDLIA